MVQEKCGRMWQADLPEHEIRLLGTCNHPTLCRESHGTTVLPAADTFLAPSSHHSFVLYQVILCLWRKLEATGRGALGSHLGTHPNFNLSSTITPFSVAEVELEFEPGEFSTLFLSHYQQLSLFLFESRNTSGSLSPSTSVESHRIHSRIHISGLSLNWQLKYRRTHFWRIDIWNHSKISRICRISNSLLIKFFTLLW